MCFENRVYVPVQYLHEVEIVNVFWDPAWVDLFLYLHEVEIVNVFWVSTDALDSMIYTK